MRLLLLILAVVLLQAAPAHAHKPSDAYLRLTLGSGTAHDGSIDMALRDLDYAIGLDGDGDGALTWGEVKARHPAIEAHLRAGLAFGTTGGACTLQPDEHLIDHHTDGAYAVVRFTVACPRGNGLTLRYGLFFDIDPTHRGLLTVNDHGRTTTGVLSPDQPVFQIATGSAGRSGFGSFLLLGIEHLLLGLDHLLFLLVLLLPVAYRRTGGVWLPVSDWRSAAIDVVKILSAFTLAHGLSLIAGVTGLVNLPTRLVESAIAATIVLAAADNVRPFLPGTRWLVAFCFGLIHGLGFAAALGPLDLSLLDLGVALLGFNLGIEAAQVGVALCFLAAAYPLRTLGLYARGLLPAGSLGALVLASLWFVDRAFAVDVAPF